MNCQCPRCGTRSFETLQTYSHCANCLYYEDHFEDVQSQVVRAVQIERALLAKDQCKDKEDFARTA